MAGNRRYTDEVMLDELRRVARRHNNTLSVLLYKGEGAISHHAIAARFGSWLNALGRAGVTPRYAYGGMWFSCPVCGEKFRSDNGAKSRRTCGPKCAAVSKASKTRTPNATPQAHRGRARTLLLQEGREVVCVECGGRGGRIECHHRNGDHQDNRVENLEWLCVRCHRRHHDRINKMRHGKSRRRTASSGPKGDPVT